MTDRLRIRQLLEELMDSDHTPEEACREFPELLPEVRERWQRMRMVEAEVEALFPTPDPAEDPGRRRRSHTAAGGRGGGELPSIPGYEFEGVLGSGGMGVVYKARHLKLKRPVAIKMLLSGVYASPRELESLMREAEAVAGLRHAHIVQVHDVGDLDGLPFFTMEFIEGGTLAQKLAGVPQPARDAAAMVVTLAAAVHAAHLGGIVHRDLKPANILLTSDGTPKIADFSLARHFEGDSALTLSTARVGTPSYMAPEQAMGKAAAFCPAVDIYALGALLYEMLTGRPPFRAETPAETQRQVIAEEPAPPSHLNARVPRDLETICLTCLQKDPAKRYATAAALGDDLNRFLRGEPIAARPAGRAERAVKWLRRRPAQAAAVTATSMVVATLLAGAAWTAWQRDKAAHLIAGDLHEVELSQSSSDWSAARAALERARTRLGEGGTDALRARVEQSERDLGLVTRLDAIRLNRTAIVGGRFSMRVNSSTADKEYLVAFRDAGLAERPDEDPAVVAERVGASSIRAALIAALDDWAACNTRRPQRQAWLLEIARRADPDPAGWRNRARDPKAWNDKATLLELVGAVPDSERSLSLLLALGERLNEHAADAVPFLKRVQQEYPSDFWANFTVGLVIGLKDPSGAIRYFQAAVALRPDAAVARNNLAMGLVLAGQLDEAIDQLRQAIRLEPTLALAHNSLGNALSLKGSPARAMEEYQQAITLNPTSASPYNNMGKTLAETGRPDQALPYFQKAIELDPESSAAYSSLGVILLKQGELDEAFELCDKALRIDPDSAAAHVNLALVLKAQGKLEPAIGHLQEADRLEPGNADTLNNYGAALAAAGRESEAADQYRQAIRINPRHAGAHHGLGVCVGEAGDLDAAIDYFRQAIAIDPTRAVSIGALGRALMARGRFVEARIPLQQFLDTLGADDRRRAAIVDFLRQCDLMIALDSRLDAVLRGDEKPADAAECLCFAELCGSRKMHAPAAQFFADAFTLAPALAEDAGAGHRYNAACDAALAGSAPEEDDASRARWREQSRRWLRADLAALTAELAAGDVETHARVRKQLGHWRADRDLAAIRDAAALEALPAPEQEECRALWADVEALLARPARDQ